MMKHLFLTLSLVLAIQSIQPLFAQEQEAVDKPLFERGPKDDEYIAAFMADSDVRRLRYSAENGDACSGKRWDPTSLGNVNSQSS